MIIDGPATPLIAPGLWQVTEGQIDLFAVAESNGRRIGNRYFIRTVQPGDILVSTPPADHEPQWQLLAFAEDPATLQQVRCEGAIGLPERIDAWVSDLAATVARAHGYMPGGSVLAPGETVRLAADTVLGAGRDVVWAEIGQGSVHLFDEPTYRFSQGCVIPLTGAGCITVDTDGADLHGLATIQILNRPDWMDQIMDWQTAMMGLLAARIRVMDHQEAARAEQSMSWSRHVMQATVDRFADPLVNKHDRTVNAQEDPLTSVCRAVVQALGFEMPQQPPHAMQQALGMLEQIARCTRMPVREVTLHGEWWRDRLGPLIAFRRDTSVPVALLPGPRGRYKSYDPLTHATEPLTVDEARQLDAVAFVLYPPLQDRPLRARDLLWISLKEGRRDLALLATMGAIGSVLGLAVPIATGVLIDQFIPSHLEWQLVELGGLLLLIVVVMVILRITQDLAQVRIVGRGANRLQPAILDRTVRLTSSFLKRFTSVDLAERVNVIEAVRNGLSVIAIDAVVAGIFSLSAIVLLMVFSLPLGMVAALLAVPLILAATWASYSQLPALATSEARGVEASQLVFQLVENISHLRAAGAEERAFARWGVLHRDMHTALLRASRAGNRLNAFSLGYTTLGLAAFFVALHSLGPTNITVGTSVMFVSLYANFLTTSTSFCNGLQRILLLQPKLERAKVLLLAEPESDTTRLDPGQLRGRIDLSHLSFGYVDGAPPILEDISLTIEPGQFVAIVGPSGCGKTTLLKLLLGFEKPHSGSILYDGQDLKHLDPRTVRRQIGTVLQTDRLIPGSLFENILGVTGRTNEEAWDAARRAGLADDIEAMPMGMHTLLIDGAVTLSGGQAQRLLIARALVGNPRMIFFDEATSALDEHAQAIVMSSLERMAITRLVIAHRVTTIRRADCIFVIDAGRVVQSGTYDDLSSNQGLFAELIQRQTI
jgi:NHLM bacteriocin system ABC transporter ATP-binding protein